MEQLSIQKIDKKWQDFWSKNRIISKASNFIHYDQTFKIVNHDENKYEL